MPLLTYEEARPWAKSIKAALLSRKMPPWFADPKYGHFMNDRRLSDQELATIVAWVDGGAAEGHPKEAPAAKHWEDGWNIRPDAIYQMPDAYKIPATGTLDYIYIVIPSGLTKDTWVTAGEVRPGAPDHVHHAIVCVRPPGSTWMKDAKPWVPYILPKDSGGINGQIDALDPQSDPVNLNYEFLAGYSPGMGPQRFDMDHSAKLIPAYSDLVFQLHYTTNGKTTGEDRTKIALTMADAPPLKRFYSAVVAGANWTIPPGDPNYEGHATLTFGEPVELVFMQPHMHYRGKDMTVHLTWPSGKSEILLSVPHYDFSWQLLYYLEKPLMLPKGSKIQIVGHWDNSPNNPYNPDPKATVKWGDQSWDEMLSMAMGVIVDRDD
jgi:hypothetical protein